jgi:hypothetical protein
MSATPETVMTITKHPHEQRVVEERRELSEKLTSLCAFICASPVFEKMDPEDRRLMREQCDAMINYRDALDARIARFVA